MPKQGKTPKKKSKEKTPQKSGESEYPEMDQEEFNRLFQNAIEQSQAQLQLKHEEQIKRLEADREALEEKLMFSDISFGMCWCLMSWVQQVHNAAVVARSLGCQCDTEMPTGRTLTETWECGNPLNPASEKTELE